MKIERTKYAKEGVIWGLLAKIVTILFPFLVRTTIIKTVGFDYIGLNGLFTSLLELLNLTELGVGTAIVFSMYKPIAEDDEDTICALMNLFKKLYRIIGVIVLVFGLCLLPFIGKLIKGDTPADINIYILYLIYLFDSVLTYWLFAYKTCILNAHQRTDVINKINLVLRSFLYSLQIVVLVCFHNYYAFIVVSPLIGILINIVNAYYANKLFPKYHCRGRVGKELRADIKKRIGGLLLTKVAYKVRYSLGNIVISAFLGLQIISIYNNYFYVMNAVAGLFTVISTSITAGIGNSIALDTKEKNEKDMIVLSFIYLTFSFFCFCCLLSLYQPFMLLWVGGKNMFSNEIMFFFCLFFLVDKTLNIIGIYYDAAGLWWKGRFKGLIEVFFHILLTILLSKYYGVIGTLIAAIISILLIGFPLTSFFTYKHYYMKSGRTYITTIVSLLFVFGIIGIFSYSLTNYLLNGIPYNEYLLRVFLTTLLNIAISSLLYYFCFRNTSIFQLSRNWIKKHL